MPCHPQEDLSQHVNPQKGGDGRFMYKISQHFIPLISHPSRNLIYRDNVTQVLSN